MKRWKAIVISVALVLAIPAQCQDVRPDDEVVILRNQLRQLMASGSAMRFGGIDLAGSFRLLAERIIEIDERLQKLEKKR